MRRANRPTRLVLLLTVVALAAAAGCAGGGGSVTIHGSVRKTIGRPCDLLSSAFPAVDGRTVTFSDDADVELGRAVTGAQQERSNDEGGCTLLAPYGITLAFRDAYTTQVSSRVAEIAPAPAVRYDDLAANGWRLDITIPATS